MKNRLPQWLWNEWEKVVFGVVLALSLLLMLVWIGQQSAGYDFHGVSQAPLQHESMFTGCAWAFLRSPATVSVPERDAFHWQFSVPKPKAEQQPRKILPPPPPAAAKQEVETAILAPTAPTAETPASQHQERPQPVPGVVKFTFQGKDRTGKSIAILSWRRQGQGGLARTATLGVGEEVFGLRVVGISEEEVLAIDARGRRIRIKLQQETRVWLEGK